MRSRVKAISLGHVSEVHQRACQSDGGLAPDAVYRNTDKAKACYYMCCSNEISNITSQPPWRIQLPHIEFVNPVTRRLRNSYYVVLISLLFPI